MAVPFPFRSLLFLSLAYWSGPLSILWVIGDNSQSPLSHPWFPFQCSTGSRLVIHSFYCGRGMVLLFPFSSRLIVKGKWTLWKALCIFWDYHMIFLSSFDQATVIFSAFFRLFLFLGKKQTLISIVATTQQGEGGAGFWNPSLLCPGLNVCPVLSLLALLLPLEGGLLTLIHTPPNAFSTRFFFPQTLKRIERN